MLAIPNQIPGAIERYGLSRAQVDWEVWAVGAGGERFSGPAAINRTLHELGGFWAAVSALYRLPPLRFIEHRVYRWVANHRPLFSRIWGAPPEWPDGEAPCSH